MTATAKRLYEQALDLDENERAELAGWLLASLDDEDQGVDAAWRDEIARRMAEIDSGAVQAVSWEEAREQLFGQHTAPHAAKKP
jgi:putative addiction module component (TIGR02574 family)